MKITSLVVEGAGRFGTPIALHGLGDGVNVLAANNEAGKSTLFRALRACLFERHTTSNKSIHDLCTQGLALPLSVKLGFSHGGCDYLLTKCFVRAPSASLRRDGIEIARGRQADEDLWEVLGVKPGSGRSVDDAVFGILWVSQRESFARPELSGGASEVLESIVHKEVGNLVGGERARKVLDALDRELQDQFTPTGKPKVNSALGRTLSVRDDLEASLADATTLLRQTDDQISRLEELRSRHASLVSPALLEKARSDLADATKALDQAGTARTELSAAELREQVARGKADAARGRLQELTGCASRVDDARNRAADLVGQIQILAGEAEGAEAQLISAGSKQDASLAKAEEEAAEERALKLLQQAIGGEQRRAELTARTSILEECSRELERLNANLAANGATAQRLTELDELERQLSALDAQLAAGATQLEVQVEPSARVAVKVDGRPVAGRSALPVTGRTVVTVGAIATVTAVAPKTYGAEQQSRQDQVNAKLIALLEQAEVLTSDQFRQARARRIDLESRTSEITGQLKGLGVMPQGLVSALEAVTTQLAELDAATATALEASGRDSLPDAGHLNAEFGLLEVRREETRSDLVRSGAAIQTHNVTWSNANAALSAAHATLEEIHKNLAIDLGRLPDETRAAVIMEAQTSCDRATEAHRICAAAFLHQQQVTPDQEELLRRETRRQRLHEALERLRDETIELEGQIRNLEGQLTARGAEGLGERAEGLAQELEIARRDADKLLGRADVLKLLKKTIEECYRQHSDRLNEPLQRHLQPFLSDLFANAKPELGDGFKFVGLRRDGPQSERFDLLSDGTQEQIAVLVRLAMGSLLCERGEPVPIILDDALVYSDDDRIEHMFDALARAGQKQQVIVLTCRLRAFATVGGRQLSLVAA